MALGAQQSLTEADSLDFLVDRVKRDDEGVVLDRLQRFILEAVSSPLRQQYETEASLNYQYVENDFYTVEELAEFAERGQPPTKRNELAPILERLAGQFIQTRQQVTFLGRNTPADDATGQIAQDHKRWVDQYNQYEFEEQEVSWDALVGGVGWTKAYVKKNELGEQVECKRSVNPFHVFCDPHSTRYDPNEDAKYIIEGSFMDLEDAIALAPDKEDEIRTQIESWSGTALPAASSVAASLLNESMLSAAMYSVSLQGTGTRRRVRPFEVWYKRKIRVYHLFKSDGVLALPVPLDSQTAKEAIKAFGSKDLMAVPTFQDRMYVGLVLGNMLLHHDVSPHETNLFPYVPFYSGRRKNGAPLPIASRLVPINESINKRESKALALLSNRQVLVEKNAIEDEDEFTTELARPSGFMVVKEGTLSSPTGPKLVIRDNLDVGAAQMQLLQEDKDSIRRVSGQGNEAMGMPSEVRSGTGIARKQMMSNLIVTPVHNNLRRSRYMLARLDYAYMKQYLTPEQTFQITDDLNAAKTVQVTKGTVQALKERIYDIVITEMKDYATLREQQAEMLLQALPQLAQHGAWMVRLGIQLSDLRDKDGLIKMVDAQSQPAPAVPKISLTMPWPDLEPEVKAYLLMASLQAPELAQAILQKAGDPAFVKKLKAELIQTQIQEGTRATIERGKVDLAALQTALEGRMQLRQEFGQDQAMNNGAASAESGHEAPMEGDA